MPVTLSVTIHNGATQTLTLMQGALTNLAAPLAETALVARSSVLRNFTEGGRPETWKPLQWPRKRGSLSAAIPLTDTGVLKNSIRSEVVGNSVILSTSVPYAAIHQFGGTVNVPAIEARAGGALRWVTREGAVMYRKRTRAHAVTIPPRPYMLLQEADVSTIVAIFERYLTASAAKG